MLKMTVRRAVTNGVAYIKLGFERVMQQRPDLEKGIADANERLATLERLAADAADDITDEDDKEAEQIRLLVQDLTKHAGRGGPRGPDLRLPAVDQDHPRHQVHRPQELGRRRLGRRGVPAVDVDEIEEIYGVDVRGHCTEYGRRRQQRPGARR